MSRAFTKEIDDLPPPPPAERAVSPRPNLVTPRGARLIESEMQRLEALIEATTDPAVLTELRRDHRYWAARRASMQITASSPAGNGVGFGSTATFIRRGKTSTVTIVGEDEADPSAGLIAWTSPLAVMLQGAQPGDAVIFDTVSGREEEIEVLNVTVQGLIGR